MPGDYIFSLAEHEGLARSNEFIRIGIPLPLGKFYETREIQLCTEANHILPSERTITAFWPDNSIKWCLLKFLISMKAHENKEVFLEPHSQAAALEKDPQTSETPEAIKIQTKGYCFHFNKNHFSPFDKITKKELSIAWKGFCSLVKEDGSSLDPLITKYAHRTAYTEYSPLYSELCITGEFKNTAALTEALFEANCIFLYETDTVKYSFAIHNPRRALHPSGLWDLGDVNSLFISELSMGFEITDKTDTRWKAEHKKDWRNLPGSDLLIYQESSGGDNWNSPNHKNKDNKMP